MVNNEAWDKIFEKYNINKHNFEEEPFTITAEQIKEATKYFTKTNQREVRILCKQDSREDRPRIFKEKGLFILPIKNGVYKIIKGEGYVDIPSIDNKDLIKYKSKLDFTLKSSKVGDSEMQHLDFAYATSLIRSFVGDDSLVLTIRGRKYTPYFEFKVGKFKIEVEGVQTEVDAGYEGKDKIVLIEAKNKKLNNIIIRQLYYPYRQWKINTKKQVLLLFFEKKEDIFNLWMFKFKNEYDYNSIELVKANRFLIVNK